MRAHKLRVRKDELSSSCFRHCGREGVGGRGGGGRERGEVCVCVYVCE